MSKLFTIAEGLENLGALKTGGQGSVYKAKRTGVITTAVKLLPTPIMNESLSDKNYTDFQNEVQKLKRVNEESNPNVVKILSSGITETGSFPYIEMEYIEGPDLEELLKPPHDPVFTIRETIKVAEHLAHALAHCHQADVRHGDVKSNNVKLNIHTGNYVLLDFGLAVMSDEQRRSSLRQAGAIEFMAPEQASGQLLFQSDVYSFGVILFELLAGKVPFPLHDRSETARNNVMVAHMETPPPSLMELREMQNIWSGDQRMHEMNVPQWLIAMIYRCLEKDPDKRFMNGKELYEHIARHSTAATPMTTDKEDQITLLREEYQRLKQENEQLKAQLAGMPPVAGSGSSTTGRKPAPPLPRGLVLGGVFFGLALLTLVLVLVLRNGGSRDGTQQELTGTETKAVDRYYKVMADRAYFHNDPDPETRRNAYLIPSPALIRATRKQGEFIYTEFTNARGQTSKGWVKVADLVPFAEWLKSGAARNTNPSAQDIRTYLSEASKLMEREEEEVAALVYGYLARHQVPEAMYQFGHLAIKGQNPELNCKEAINWMTGAIEKAYTPAKRTMGILYLYGENSEVLETYSYTGCDFDEDPAKGSRLLMEAALEGDLEAQRILTEYNSARAN